MSFTSAAEGKYRQKGRHETHPAGYGKICGLLLHRVPDETTSSTVWATSNGQYRIGRSKTSRHAEKDLWWLSDAKGVVILRFWAFEEALKWIDRNSAVVQDPAKPWLRWEQVDDRSKVEIRKYGPGLWLRIPPNMAESLNLSPGVCVEAEIVDITTLLLHCSPAITIEMISAGVYHKPTGRGRPKNVRRLREGRIPLMVRTLDGRGVWLSIPRTVSKPLGITHGTITVVKLVDPETLSVEVGDIQ